MAFGDRRDGLGAWRVDDADQRQQSETAQVDILEAQQALLVIDAFLGERQQAQATRGKVGDAASPVVGGQRLIAGQTALLVAHFQQAFGRAYHEDARVPAAMVIEAGAKTVFGFEGNAVAARPVRAFGRCLQTGLAGQHQQRRFGRVAFHLPAAVDFA